MIKYLKLDGYRNMGECGTFSHVYQWVETGKKSPIIILVHTDVANAKAFKGYLYYKTKTFVDVPLSDTEISEIEQYTGKIEQCTFTDFIRETPFEGEFDDFTKD